MPRNGSIYSDNVSTTSSQWTTTYKKLPRKQPTAIRFMSWAAGAPRGATMVKKRTRDTPDDSSVYSSWSSGSGWGDADTQLYWVTTSDYYSGSSSRSGRSSRSSSRKSSSSKQKHFNGAVPPPQMMPPPPPPPAGPGFGPPMGGHFGPPPPAMGSHYAGSHFGDDHFGEDYYGDDHYEDDFNSYPHPMPPMPPMNHFSPPPAAGGAPAFINVTGQHQPGNPFNRGGPAAGSGMESDWESGSDSGPD
ncbi:hypothetical protein BGZ63DRAFT_32503 [Mariannaea sp. PMI_226]|nr:hypothetical protein BGZ63DRAFT_32503 [Mariannaea sp. PMI_226]